MCDKCDTDAKAEAAAREVLKDLQDSDHRKNRESLFGNLAAGKATHEQQAMACAMLAEAKQAMLFVQQMPKALQDAIFSKQLGELNVKAIAVPQDIFKNAFPGPEKETVH